MTRLPVTPGDRSVPWRDVFPPAWQLKPLKCACSINRRALPETTDPDTEFRYVDISSVDSEGNWSASEPMRFGDAPSRARRIVADGDVLVSTVRTYLRAIAHVDKVDEGLICSTGFAVLSANGTAYSRFLAYWARSVYFVDEIVARSVGVSYPAVNASDVGNIPCPLLPRDEQRAIVAFLDCETARIDALIEKKRRQIELLQEKRAVLISHAVTKGLDPSAPMKDSGTEWLGKTPRHWRTCQLKYAATFQRGHDLPYQDRREGTVPVVASGGITGYHDAHRAEAPGIVTGRYGTIGTFHYIDEAYWPLNTTLYCVDTRGNHVRFLWYLVQHLSSLFLVNSSKSAVPGVDRNDLHPITVALPVKRQEQKAIASFLDSHSGRIDRLAERIASSIDRLREYRTALISAAVTGKIDVRKEVA